MQIRKIIRNINLLNILLITVIIMFISYSLLPFLGIKVRYTLPAVKKIGEQKEEKAVQTQTPSIADYTIIADENLFHPERKIPVEKKAEEKPLPKPDFVLYGTLITGDMSLAFLEDLKAPQSSPGRGKRQVVLKKGESMSGFILKDVEAEKIVMVRGEERMTVYLNESAHPKGRKESGVTTVSVQPVSQPVATPQQAQSSSVARPAKSASVSTSIPSGSSPFGRRQGSSRPQSSNAATGGGFLRPR